MDSQDEQPRNGLVGPRTPTPEGLEGLHKGLLYVCIFFFVYLIVESFFLLPFLILRYGWW